jgi:hypothetical protein
MGTPNTSCPILEIGETSSSDASPLHSALPSPSSSFVSTPTTSVTDLSEEIKHDPHDPPVFDEQLAHLTPDISYFPPLLSSLPHEFSHQTPTVSGGRAPRTSKSRLPDIDPMSLSLHKVLHNFAAITEDYAVAPYENAFNWNELELPVDDEREWYSITFRSIRRLGSDSARQSQSILLALRC